MKYKALKDLKHEGKTLIHKGDVFDDITKGLELTFDENRAEIVKYLECQSTGFRFGTTGSQLEKYFEKVED